MSDQALVPVIAAAGAGQVIHAFGEELQMHLSAQQTQGRYSMFTTTTPPGGGPPLHKHDREDEWFLVLEGSVSYFVEGQWSAPAGPGTAAFLPRGCVPPIPLHFAVSASMEGQFMLNWLSRNF